MEISSSNDNQNFEFSDDEIQPETHHKLLNAVSQIYKKQRIEEPKRREPTSQISEFNLTQKNEKQAVNVGDLLNALNERAVHNEIKKKVRNMQKKGKPLPKPLEQLHADKLRRELGYTSVQKKLNRWEAIVERNRAAGQLKFPLESKHKVVIKDSHDFLKTFKEPTELEKEISAVLQSSETAQEEKEKEEELFPLSVEEIIERRKMIAQMRARESYRIAKAVRQNKIKSKKYHRILKRERVKKELKEFEILQKTNPEAALEKLEKIERARAEERITLRHRNSGKWAKSRAIRAKYDAEARAQLAEQLAKSRELTKKVQSSLNSSSDEGEEDDEGIEEEILKIDPSNPWKPGSENQIESFLNGYKIFQDEKKDKYQDKNECITTNLTNKSHVNKTNELQGNLSGNHHVNNTKHEKDAKDKDSNSEADEESSDHNEDNLLSLSNNNRIISMEHENDKSNIQKDRNMKIIIEPKVPNTPEVNSKSEPCTIFEGNLTKKQITHLQEVVQQADETLQGKQKNSKAFFKTNINVSPTEDSSNELSDVQEDYKAKQAEKSECNVTTDKATCVRLCKIIEQKDSFFSSDAGKISKQESQKVVKKKNLPNLASTTLKIDVLKQKDSLVPKENSKSKRKLDAINELSDKKYKLSSKKHSNLTNQSGSWEVSDINSSSNVIIKKKIDQVTDSKEKSDCSIDKIFDNAEGSFKKSLNSRIKEIKDDLNSNKEDGPNIKKKTNYRADLSFKTNKNKPDLDVSLIEVNDEGTGISTGENEIKSLLDIYEKDKKDTSEEITNIDPNKFLPVKATKLNSGVLDFVEDHESDELIKERQFNLEEAFADDDVVEEFRREKEEEAESSKPKTIDLNLPGWGHWAGHNVEPRRQLNKRKNRRLIVKFPEIPRRDAQKDNVIINEDVSPALKKHMVHDLPFPFKRVKDYEASIRAPIGNTWVPQSAFMKLIQPSITTKMGAIIEPMNESQLLNVKRRKFQKK